MPPCAKSVTFAAPSSSRSFQSPYHQLDLDQVELLQGLDEPTKQSLLDSLQFHKYYPGDVVFQQGSTGSSLFFLEQGAVDVVVHNNSNNHNGNNDEDEAIVVDTIPAGSVFGELALLLDMPRTATIRASGTSVAYELQRPAFVAIAAHSPVLQERLQAIKQERWTRFRRDLEAAVLHPDELSPAQRAYVLQVFHQIDADESGAIDQDELAVMLERLAGHAFSNTDVSRMMQLLDGDGNGTIEAEEFLAGLPLLAQWLVDSTHAPKKDLDDDDDATDCTVSTNRSTASTSSSAPTSELMAQEMAEMIQHLQGGIQSSLDLLGGPF